MSNAEFKKTVDDYLNEVNYQELNTGNYVPSEFALMFIAFIDLVNAHNGGESHKNPVFHLKMLDNICGSRKNTANLCFRGSGKTTLLAEYLIPFIAIYGELPGFGKIDYMIYVSDSIENGVASLRKNLESRYDDSPFLQEWLPKAKFTEKYFSFKNKNGGKSGRLAVKLFGAKSGIRGTKAFGKRPTLAILDDLVSDEDAKSKVSMQAIKDTVYKGVDHALDPTQRKVLFLGTPFSQEDVLYQAVESGAWDVNVYPVCEKFPCTKEEFNGAWEERFSYEYVLEMYEKAEKTNTLPAFYQELMLRISDGTERLVQDAEIKWYKRETILKNLHNFNLYITTDFATSKKQTADNSVISVWAVSNNSDFFWIDGICGRNRMSYNIKELFRLVQKYINYLQTVGIETNGQQEGFIDWIQEEMMNKNVYFNLARQKGKAELGIKTQQDKLAKFNLAVPLFNAGKMYFPSEMKNTSIMMQFMNEIRSATLSGLKAKDDCLDTISMLQFMDIIAPTIQTEIEEDDIDQVYQFNSYNDDSQRGGYDSYMVD